MRLSHAGESPRTIRLLAHDYDRGRILHSGVCSNDSASLALQLRLSLIRCLFSLYSPFSWPFSCLLVAQVFWLHYQLLIFFQGGVCVYHDLRNGVCPGLWFSFYCPLLRFSSFAPLGWLLEFNCQAFVAVGVPRSKVLFSGLGWMTWFYGRLGAVRDEEGIVTNHLD